MTAIERHYGTPQDIEWCDVEHRRASLHGAVDRAVRRAGPDGPDSIEVVLVFGGVLFWEQQLKTICEKVGVSFERLLYSHLAAGERSVSAQQAFDLVALAEVARTERRASDWLSRSDADSGGMHAALAGTRFLEAFDRFLDRYGHRGLYESDWALPRYREDPTPLLQAIRIHLRDGHDTARGADARSADAEAASIRSEFERAMTGLKRWTLLPRARSLLAVVVITDPGDFGSMKRGAILVARATDPSWTPLFTLAAGVIVEVGGVLSHASTIAREYGLPALANVQRATRRLRTGDRIFLNATEGWARRC